MTEVCQSIVDAVRIARDDLVTLLETFAGILFAEAKLQRARGQIQLNVRKILVHGNSNLLVLHLSEHFLFDSERVADSTEESRRFTVALIGE